MALDDDNGLPGPRTPADLFWAFSVMALQGFGGVMAVVQRELVERRGWLSNEQFVEDWAVAQVMPGPNVCNLALMFGDRRFGWRGALAALAGLLAFPLLLLLTLGALYGRFAQHAAMVGALRGMGAVAAGLIAGTALKLGDSLRRHPMGALPALLLAAAAFAGVALARLPLHLIVFVLGAAAYTLTWRALRRGERR
ncbi:chromate transporter [Rubrivivax gelatinosus]|uniref:Chromate transporter n=1 Tax=Rubrivivax gelatinosus TaxID=28068 RepID=A0A4V2SH32_RUBGE|nr:chromate transporter [Rubrivivax gelatinosus]MBK1690238.1 chromate transporter [Rubrivivax gelatinosus]TCP03578.1 chromate transporter [Rubrivivax gelatinosus]